MKKNSKEQPLWTNEEEIIDFKKFLKKFHISFKRGINMKKNSNWKVVINTDNPKKHTISVINNKECFSEYPIIYPNGKVAFDHPERIPGYVKKEVYSIAEKVFKYNNKR